MNTSLLVILGMLVWTAQCVLTYIVAEAKGRNSIGFALAACLLGPLPFLAALGMPTDDDARLAEQVRRGQRTRCAECASPMYPEARRCAACGALVVEPTPTPEDGEGATDGEAPGLHGLVG